MNLDFNQIVPSIPFIMGGIWVTLKFVSVSLIIGLILGTFLAILKIGKVKVLVILSDIYTSIFRGTPLILQLSIIYFATPQLIDYNISAYEAGVLTFGLNSAAYISEIIRAGIQAVDKGQKEAAEALGIPYNQMMLKIILPQAFRNILPALFNEFITLTKESAIVSVIGVMDILRRSQVVASNTFAYFEPLLIAGVIYYVLVMALTLLGKLLERRLKRSD
ncbi:amino acid ABC transporter permease [Alkalihalobacterium chitinilyticum]|uniref:Amino acid ABC transporter permease n=1 Tax=Alkalihalobacterium chitinilyticum TaxID=2980103 RepID=A0ABT5VA38_9BACI|nr:amino acid ABC transporter permease [Alkalihalobacterium chitinilyticum]MDE5412202.1 amino acid ABC transporter permease [Alkalihalobacterium chitinilyticum]